MSGNYDGQQTDHGIFLHENNIPLQAQWLYG